MFVFTSTETFDQAFFYDEGKGKNKRGHEHDWPHDSNTVVSMSRLLSSGDHLISEYI